ncbi:AEC family transporter [Litchfieldella xinjiangensis]|uniref:AEC family transporter n=1 Tax=Litchfieldella xinjiangensis TaxID=1166948 RepID=UPI0005BA88F9|nr:AEC family transporter [Halomonas xinjiangensis]
MSVFTETLNVTLPVFSMVFIGIGLRRAGWIDQAFINTASSLVFKATMPTLLFLSIIKSGASVTSKLGILSFYLGITFICFLGIWAWAIARYPPEDRGVFVQGGFRGNCGIVGLALSASMYGDYGLSLGGIMAGGVIVLNLILSALILEYYSVEKSNNAWKMAKGIALNPLILSILLALPVSTQDLEMPTWLMTTAERFGSLSLPLALICIGGSLSTASIKESGLQALDASLWKVLWMPALGVLAAIGAGFRNAELGMLFLFLGSPGAAVSYVMARAVKANSLLAANIIVISTFLSMATIIVGVFILITFGLI